MEKENIVSENLGPIIELTPDKKNYFKCSMYYMRRYFGIREIVILAILLGVGLALFFMMAQMLILVFFAISVGLILIALVLFLITSVGGFKVDMEKRGIAKQRLEFQEEALIVTNYDIKGNPIFRETHPYERIEKVSIKKKRIYIYASVSVFYYIWAKDYEPELCDEIVSYMKKVMKPETFKFKRRSRVFPKKKKLTLEEE